MNSNQTYRQITAFLLAFLVLQVVAWKEAHHLFGNHHHEQAHCDDTLHGESHLHGEEYAPIDCSICFFSFAPATLDYLEFAVKATACEPLPKIFIYQKTLAARVNWHFHHRGPPALAA